MTDNSMPYKKYDVQNKKEAKIGNPTCVQSFWQGALYQQRYFRLMAPSIKNWQHLEVGNNLIFGPQKMKLEFFQQNIPSFLESIKIHDIKGLKALEMHFMNL